MHNTIDFKDHAQLLLNPYFDGELRFGSANSYGLEFLMKKRKGQFTGWISYTLAKTMRNIPDIDNKPFYAPCDKTHDISIIGSYDITERINISSNWVFSTALPVTVPTGKFEYQGMLIPVYNKRNIVRIPGTEYHRLDLSVTIKNNPDKKRRHNKNNSYNKYRSSWNFSVYNAYSRHNTYSVKFKQSETNTEITEVKNMYLFKIIPAITYNFEF